MVLVNRVAGNCATVKLRQLDDLLSRKQTALQLCEDCPLQYNCIATLLVSHDRNSCMGGLNYEERIVLQQQITDELHATSLSANDVVVYLRAHPDALSCVRCEYRRRQRSKRNSLRRRQYTREYMSGYRTLTELARQNAAAVTYY